MTAMSTSCWTDSEDGSAARGERRTKIAPTARIVITDLMTGQYSDPVRVVAFNTAEGWSRDVTNDFADELAKWHSEQDSELPLSLEDFIQRHRTAKSEQLSSPLAVRPKLRIRNRSG